MRGRVAHLAGALSVAVSLALAAPQTAYGNATEFSTYDVRAPGSYRSLPDVLPQPQPASTTFLGRWSFGLGICDAQGWVSTDLTAGAGDFGDFAALFPGFQILQHDPCMTEYRCVWGFINGSTDTYDCGAQPGQAVVPYGNPSDGYLHNEIISPTMPVSGARSNFTLTFNVYADLPLENLVFYYWRVRSIKGGTPGPWRDRHALNYGAGETPRWTTVEASFGDLVDTDADAIQIAIGAVDMKGEWGGILGDGMCHSHAPLITDVRVFRVTQTGPQWFAHPIDLFQDAFPADGSRTGTVRMDAARDIAPRGSPMIRAGDSLVVAVGEPTVGLGYHDSGVPSSGPAVYLHVRDVSPEKSGAAVSGSLARWPVVAQSNGWTTLRMDSVRGPTAAPNLFCVDLNDSLYTPPDVVDYILSARDAMGRTTYWSERGGAFTTLSQRENRKMEVSCLPASPRAPEGFLYVDGAGGTEVQSAITQAFALLGITGDVDRYDVRGPDYLSSNGPGSRVADVTGQLGSTYRWVIWNTGAIASGLLGDGTGSPGKAPDLQLVDTYLDNLPRNGGVYFSGDNIATGMAGSDPGVVAGVGRFIDLVVPESNYFGLGLGVSPRVGGLPCSPFDHLTGADTLVAFGGCPALKAFDVIAPGNNFGPAQVSMHYIAAGDVQGAVLRQRVTNTLGFKAGVLLSGFSHHVITNDRPQSPPDFAEQMRDAINWLAGNFPSPLPPDQPLLTATPVENGIELWSFPSPYACDDYSLLRLYREPDALLLEWPVAMQNRTLVDTNAIVGEDNRYRLVGVGVADAEVVIAEAHAVRPLELARIEVTPEDMGIAITWDVPETDIVSGFSVWRSDDPQRGFMNITPDSVLSVEARRFLDTSVTPRQQYTYMLVIHYSSGVQSESAHAGAVARAALLLAPNAPNPFNPSTRIVYVLPDRATVEIAVFDVAGRRVTTLVNGERPGGYNTVEWDGSTSSGARAGSGVYFCRMVTSGEVRTHKMMLVK